MAKVKLNQDLAVLAKLEDLSVKELGKYKLICPPYVWVPLNIGIYTDMTVKQEDNLIIMTEEKGWTTVWLNAKSSEWEIEVSNSYSIVSYNEGLFISLPADGYMIATRSEKTYRINLKEGTSDSRLTYEELTTLIKALR
mgnify:CR=1 FL=1